MTDYYVDATQGNDRRSGQTPVDAWQTVVPVNELFARSTLLPGDKVLFARGQEHRFPTALEIVNCNGTVEQSIIMGAYGEADRRPVLVLAQESDFLIGCWTVGTEYIRFEHLELLTEHLPSGRGTIWAEACRWRLHDIVQRRGDPAVTQWNTGIKIRWNSHCVLTECDISNPDGEGLYVGRAYTPEDQSTVEVYNSRFHDCLHEGIDFKDGARDCIIQDCLIENNAPLDENGEAIAAYSQISAGGWGHLFERCTIRGRSIRPIQLADYVGDAGGQTLKDCLLQDGNQGVRFAGRDNLVEDCIIQDCHVAFRVPAGKLTGTQTIRNVRVINTRYGDWKFNDEAADAHWFVVENLTHGSGGMIMAVIDELQIVAGALDAEADVLDSIEHPSHASALRDQVNAVLAQVTALQAADDALDAAADVIEED